MTDLKSRLKSGTTQNSEEKIPLFNEKTNAFEGTIVPRNTVRLNNYTHRASYIFVMDDEGNVIVQKRSELKDYLPGYYDCAAGGLVGVDDGNVPETWECNASRELDEEMGLKEDEDWFLKEKLFVFYYKDERTSVWGGAWIVKFQGQLDQLQLQEEEVDCVEKISIADIFEQSSASQKKFTPDSLYALSLLQQYLKSLRSPYVCLPPPTHSSYKLQAPLKAVFIDVDDCIYFDDWTTAKKITSSINSYCVDKLQLDNGKAYEIYKKHGTALKGLIKEKIINGQDEIDHYLSVVHDIDLDFEPNPAINELISSIKPGIKKYIFTASCKSHAIRVLKKLQVDFDHDKIVDTAVCNFESKHSKSSFLRAMTYAGIDEEDAPSCVLIDDSTRNIQTAHEIGWRGVLVGRNERDGGRAKNTAHAEALIDNFEQFRDAVPEAFVERVS